MEWREVLSIKHSLDYEPYIEVYYYKEIIAETDKAWLLEMNGDERHWIPKSKCWVDKESKTLYIPRWLEQRILFGT